MHKNTSDKIIDLLKKQDWPITTEEVAVKLNIAWGTAQIHLLKLVNSGKIKHKKVGRQNQFWLLENYNKYFEKRKI